MASANPSNGPHGLAPDWRFDDLLLHARERARALADEVCHEGLAGDAQAADVIEELSALLEEAWVADQELKIQKEQLEEAYAELHLQLQRYRAHFEQAVEPQLMTGPDGTITEANAVCAQIFRVSPEDMVRKHITRFLASDNRQLESKLGELTASPDVAEFVVCARSRAELPFPLQARVSSIIPASAGVPLLSWKFSRAADLHKDAEPYHAGRFAELEKERLDLAVQLEGAVRENERLRAAEDALKDHAEESIRVRDEFLAVVSHELRTPLNAIANWTELLAKLGNDESMLARGIETIRRNARAQANIISDLLDMSKLMKGRFRLDIDNVHLDEILSDLLEQLRPEAEQHSIRLDHSIAPGIAPLRGDQARLRQLLFSLLSNALKFTPPGGKVSATLEPVERGGAQFARVCIEDNGIGITPEFLPRIFDRFAQQAQATTRLHGGLGLGLTIAREIAGLHDGRLTVTSEGEGKGAVFTVELPVGGAVMSRQFAGAELPARGLGALKERCEDHTRVLLVMQDRQEAEQLAEALAEHGISVSHAVNSHDAVRALKEGAAQTTHGFGYSAPRRFDVLVGDMSLSGDDGLDLIREVRRLLPPVAASIPAIALTRDGAEKDAACARAQGYQAELVKPVKPRALLAQVEQLLSPTRTSTEDGSIPAKIAM